jgi:hypothetical protein
MEVGYLRLHESYTFGILGLYGKDSVIQMAIVSRQLWKYGGTYLDLDFVILK